MLSDILQQLPRASGRPLLDRVLILDEVGRGAMGVVHAGWHQTLEIPVAVKFLANQLANRSDLLARFRREARICAELDEPNLLRVLDLGDARGVPYLVMEWIPGRSLEAIVQGAGPLSEHEVATVLRDVGLALLALHRRGVIHRDVKPANLLLRARDGRVKLADLGLATEQEAQQLGLTQGLLGTPSFMSPEQVHNSHAVTPASDLFSLGATAFALLTGRDPFQGTSAWEVMTRIVNDPLTDPASVGVRVSETMRALLTRLTEKDPAKRIASGEELLKLLPDASLPFRPEVIAAAHPPLEISRQTGLEPTSVASLRRDSEPRPVDDTAATLCRSSGSGAMQSPARALLFCQCLQRDFMQPIAKGMPLPNRLHVGWSEAARIVGEDPGKGPLTRAVSACAAAEHVHIVHIRDWHDPSDPHQKAELEFFGEHCLMGSPGARFIDEIEQFSRDRRRSAVIDSNGISDFEDTPMVEVLDALAGDADRGTLPVGVVGAWTNVKVQYLVYDLKTRGRFGNIATCSALVAAPDRVAHQQALRHLEETLGVKVFASVSEFLGFLGVSGA
ncbi:MAG: isochorismatase family protein [Myxococcales bacterium]